MYIEPNTTIKILHNVPLDNTYEHTIYFPSISDQNTYFNSQSLVKYVMAKQTYQRVVKGKIRLEQTADNLYDCNYLAFQNTNFGTKWFYAFITSVEYINNITSEISFELDVMQTFMFDYTMDDVFVEREHCIDDTIGANTIKEPIVVDTADVFANTDYLFNEWSVVISAVPGAVFSTLSRLRSFAEQSREWANGELADTKPWQLPQKIYLSIIANLCNIIDGILDNALQIPSEGLQPYVVKHTFTGAHYFIKDIINWTPEQEQESGRDIKNFIQDYLVPLGFSINNVYMTPREFVNARTSQPIFIDLDDEYFEPCNQFAYISKNEFYTPHNNKLRTSPYTYFRMGTSDGNHIDLAYEKLPTIKTLDLYCNWVGRSECTLQFAKYGAEPSHEDRLTSLSLSGFPTCNWSEGGLGSILSSTIKNGLNSLVSMGTGLNRPTEIRGDIYPINRNTLEARVFEANKNKEFANKNISEGVSLINSVIGASNNLQGSSSPSVDACYGRMGFIFYGMAITGEQAEIIDDYFDKYGYATMRLKTPNTHSRPHWNYVKTRDCTIKTNNMPVEYSNKICSIYNSGITFWKHGNEIGNYSLDNSIQS